MEELVEISGDRFELLILNTLIYSRVILFMLKFLKDFHIHLKIWAIVDATRLKRHSFDLPDRNLLLL